MNAIQTTNFGFHAAASFLASFLAIVGCNPSDLFGQRSGTGGNPAAENSMPAYPDARNAYATPVTGVAIPPSQPLPAAGIGGAKTAPDASAVQATPASTSLGGAVASPPVEVSQSDWCNEGCKKVFACQADVQNTLGGAEAMRKHFGKTREDCNIGCLREKDMVVTDACKTCLDMTCDRFAPCIVENCIPKH